MYIDLWMVKAIIGNYLSGLYKTSYKVLIIEHNFHWNWDVAWAKILSHLGLVALRLNGPVNLLRWCWGHSFNLLALFPGRVRPNQYLVHILTAATGNCPSGINEKERIFIENISQLIFSNVMWLGLESNSRPLDQQSDVPSAGLWSLALNVN